MDEQSLLLAPNGDELMDLRATEPGQAQEPRLGTAKYLYASGSRPLSGYVIKRGVGRGGFGEVYFATSDAGKEVALKLVRRNLDVELRGVVQCLNLRHPNLVALYDIRQDDDQDTWVIMEYVAGRTLDRVVGDYPQGMPPVEAIRWMQGIGAGVAYLHDHGIVHRDLKPGNVFYDEGLVKLGDYGLSKFISASRRSGQTESVGTVHYMAPEVANGRYGKEIDIYALGVMFYEMLTGRVPFEGESVGEVLMKHLTAQPDLSPLVEPYRSVVARALNKDPEQRFRTVGELMAALDATFLSPTEMNVMVAGATAPAPSHPATPVANASPMPFNGVAGALSYLAGATQAALQTPHPAHTVPAHTVPASAPASVDPYADDEPIWRWVRTSWLELRAAWKRADLHPAVRVAILLVALLIFLSTTGIWLPAALFYGIYRFIRVVVNAGYPSPPLARTSQPPPLPGAAPRPQAPQVYTPPANAPQPYVPPAAVATPMPVQPVRQRIPSSPFRPGTATLPKTTRERFTELLSSLLASALVVAVVCVLASPLFDRRLQATQFLWLGSVATVGAWGVLIPAKLWERRPGDELPRRFTMLIVGLLLGLFAWGVERLLIVDLPYSTNSAVREATTWAGKALQGGRVHSVVFDSRGAPTLEGFLAYFGFLFPVLRWWKLADPQRRSRVGLWRTATYGAWAFVLCLFWRFPEQFAVVTATSIALAVQLASPWTDATYSTTHRAE